MRFLVPLLALTAPTVACPPPPPGIEVVANDKTTIAPDGGIIVRLADDFSGGRNGNTPLTVQVDGANADFTREYIAFDLTVLRPKVRGKQLEVMRGGKAIHTLQLAATPTLAAPKLVRAHSTAARPSSKNPPPAQMYPPMATSSVEILGDTPADAFALVIYKIEPTGTRSIASGTPDKHVIQFVTGGKQCRGGFETLYPGERVAVAWLDVHGKLSPKSQAITVGAAKP
jgi:hypothetical protein